MFKLYYASAIDAAPDWAEVQITSFKLFFSKFPTLEVYGAGFKDSPIITPETNFAKKGVIVAYDLRLLRQCDILLIVTDSEMYAAGTFQEMEYARQLGLYIIVLCLSNQNVKNIFIEKNADLILYNLESLENILRGVVQ